MRSTFLLLLGTLAAGGLLVSGLTSDLAGARTAPANAPATAARATSPSGAIPAPGTSSAARHPERAPTRPAKLPPHPPVAAKAPLPPERGTSGAAAQPASAFTRFGVGERNVKRILLDGERIWVATSGGLIRYAPKIDEYRLYDARSGLRSSEVLALGKLDGRIAAATPAGGLSLLDASGERWEHYAGGEGEPVGIVHDLLRASGGDVWIATRSGAWRVAGGELGRPAAWTRFTASATQGGLPSDRVYGLAEGRGGEIWFATEAGIAVYRRGEWKSWSVAGEAKDGAHAGAHGRAADGRDFVVAVATDPDGHVWAGTLGAGLARYDGKAWKRYTVDEGLPGNNVLALHGDESGRLWIGTDRGLARMEGGRFRVLTRRDGLYADAVFAVASAPEALWVGGYGGVARLRGAP